MADLEQVDRRQRAARRRSAASTGASASPVSSARKPPWRSTSTTEPLLMSPSGSGAVASASRRVEELDARSSDRAGTVCPPVRRATRARGLRGAHRPGGGRRRGSRRRCRHAARRRPGTGRGPRPVRRHGPGAGGQDQQVDAAGEEGQVGAEAAERELRVRPAVDEHGGAARRLDQDRVALADVEHRDVQAAIGPRREVTVQAASRPDRRRSAAGEHAAQRRRALPRRGRLAAGSRGLARSQRPGAETQDREPGDGEGRRERDVDGRERQRPPPSRATRSLAAPARPRHRSAR